MKRPEASEAPKVGKNEMPDPKLAENYPTISEYLSHTTWDDGKPRKPSKLSVGVKDSGINLALNDDEMKQSCYSWGRSLDEALATMEDGLRGGDVEWRAWKKGK